MRRAILEPLATLQLEEIYAYTNNRWGEAQAERYVRSLFDAMDGIAAGTIRSQPIAEELNVDGYVHRHAHHFIYWWNRDDGDVGIVAILHERMHQGRHVRAAYDRSAEG